MEMSAQFHDLASLCPVSIGQEAKWTPEQVLTWWKREKSLSLLGIKSWSYSP